MPAGPPPRTPRGPLLAPSLDTVGILARSPADVRALYEAVAEPPGAALAPKSEAGHGRGAAVPRDWSFSACLPTADAQAELVHLLERLMADLSRRFALRQRPLLPLMDEAGLHAQAVLHREAAQTHRATLAARYRRMAPSTRSIVVPGLAIPEHWREQALAHRERLLARLDREGFAGARFLLLPALDRLVPDRALAHRDSAEFRSRELLALHRWMPLANYLDLPAAVLPVAQDSRGRPVSVQLLARRGDDIALLDLCEALQREGLHRVPALPQAVRPSFMAHPSSMAIKTSYD